MVFNMVHTAYEWGLEPSKFFELPAHDKALMITYSNVVSKMKAAASQGEKRKLVKDG